MEIDEGRPLVGHKVFCRASKVFKAMLDHSTFSETANPNMRDGFREVEFPDEDYEAMLEIARSKPFIQTYLFTHNSSLFSPPDFG